VGFLEQPRRARSAVLALFGMISRTGCSLRRAVGGILILALASAASATSQATQQESASVADRYQALVKTLNSGGPDFRNATTDAERRAAVERLHVIALRYVEFAEAHASDPIVLDAALEAIRALNGEDSLTQTSWELSESDFPAPGEGNPGARAVALLLRDHVRSEKVGPICLRMCYGLRPEYETYLKRVVEENPDKEVRGIACLALAQFLNSRLLKLDVFGEQPEFAARYALLLGKEAFDALRKRDRAEAGAEVEAWFTKAAETFGDVKHPYGGTIGEKARSELFEIRNLTVGKTAPDIVGVDQDGKPLKLSEYRGRVVLLDFWSEF